MKKKMLLVWAVSAMVSGLSAQTARVWTLRDCIDYALEHNIQLKKAKATAQSAGIDLVEAKAGRLPTLSASVTQSLQYRPFQETASSLVNGSIASSSSNKTTQSGSYGVDAAWTVWNGNKTRLNIRDAELGKEISEYESAVSANSIQEQIAQLYVQILYMQEAVKVNEALLRHDETICERGREMVRQGQMSRSDLAQLEAQASSGRYDVVNAKTQIADSKMQLSQLLELEPGDIIDIDSVSVTDAAVLAAIPDKMSVYETALSLRPEIKSGEADVARSELAVKIARAAYMPTISLTAGLGDSHMTGTRGSYFNQMKNNFAANIGVSVSIPIFDNRKTKSSVERAEISKTTAQLDLQDAQKELYKSIETYWLNAVSNREKYLSSKDNVASLQASDDLINEQFRLGLKNIVELLTSRGNLLSAKQEMLQNKYTALLNATLLKFYGGEVMEL